MKKALFFIPLFTFLSIKLSSQFAYSWLNTFSTNGTTLGLKIIGIESSYNGNVYILGNFSATTDFDCSASNFFLTPAATQSCFLAKYNANGGFIWAKEVVAEYGISYDHPSASDLVIDNNENVYISGAFSYTVDFDPSPSTYTLSAQTATSVYYRKIFTSKYDLNGNFIWVKDYGNINTPLSTTGGLKIALDNLNNVYQGGMVNSIPIIIKYSNSGAILWKDSLYTSGSQAQLQSMFVSPLGDVYIGGNFDTSIDMDPTSGVSNLFGTHAFFIGKYNTNGTLIWAKKLNGTVATELLMADIVADNLGNVYSCGVGLVGTTYKNQFCKWDNMGNLLWQNYFGTGSFAKLPFGVSLNCNNDLTLTGLTSNNITIPENFDPLGGTYTTSPSSAITGAMQMFVATYNTLNGGILWAKCVGGKINPLTQVQIGNLWANPVNPSFIDNNGEIYLAGLLATNSTSDDFDPGLGTVSTNSASTAFFAKYSGCSSVGIEEYKLHNQVSISPNPSTSQFYFNGLVGKNTIQITDITGRVLFTENTTTENYTLKLDAAQGVYFYKISDKQNRIQQGKLIIN
jgi:hypothetical protein